MSTHVGGCNRAVFVALDGARLRVGHSASSRPPPFVPIDRSEHTPMVSAQHLVSRTGILIIPVKDNWVSVVEIIGSRPPDLPAAAQPAYTISMRSPRRSCS